VKTGRRQASTRRQLLLETGGQEMIVVVNPSRHTGNIISTYGQVIGNKISERKGFEREGRRISAGGSIHDK
jgi:hypothetical protein